MPALRVKGVLLFVDEKWESVVRGKVRHMIELTRLNNQPLLVNADLIKLVEQAPDTVITLVTGEKLVVRESTREVVRRVIEFRRSLLADLHDGPSVRLAREPQDEDQGQ